MHISSTRLSAITVAGVLIAVAGLGIFWASSGSDDPPNTVSVNQQKTLASAPNIDAAYSSAAENTSKCLTDAGLKDVATQRDAAGKVSFTWGGFATREGAQHAGEIYKDCYFANLDDVDRTWQQSPERDAAATDRGWDVMRCVETAVPGFKFGTDEAGVNAQFASLDRERRQPARQCLSAAGTDIVKFTPLPR